MIHRAAIFIALMLLVAFSCQETRALASVTGTLTATVVDAETSVPIAGVQVSAISPSQIATSATDAAGHFAFPTLAPDTYTITVSKIGYQSTSVVGQVVLANGVHTISLKMVKAPGTIAHVTSTAPGKYSNEIIMPVQSWQLGGQDCYYGRYEFTYPDGTTESGDIVWPFCYDQGIDPFTHRQHLIPFPLPLLGFKLPVDAKMPPIERRVYEKWAAANTPASSPP